MQSFSPLLSSSQTNSSQFCLLPWLQTQLGVDCDNPWTPVINSPLFSALANFTVDFGINIQVQHDMLLSEHVTLTFESRNYLSEADDVSGGVIHVSGMLTIGKTSRIKLKIPENLKEGQHVMRLFTFRDIQGDFVDRVDMEVLMSESLKVDPIFKLNSS